MNAALEEILDHTLIGVDAHGTLCSCGDRTPFRLHLVSVVDLVAPQDTPWREKRQAWAVAGRLARTRAVLAAMDAEQRALGDQADRLGLIGFVERSDWLIAQRVTNERLYR